MVFNKTEVTPHNIRYDKGDYFVCGVPKEYVTIAVMCVPEVPTPQSILLSWDEYVVHSRDGDSLGIGLTKRVWRDIQKGMYEPPLETIKDRDPDALDEGEEAYEREDVVEEEYDV